MRCSCSCCGVVVVVVTVVVVAVVVVAVVVGVVVAVVVAVYLRQQHGYKYNMCKLHGMQHSKLLCECRCRSKGRYAVQLGSVRFSYVSVSSVRFSYIFFFVFSWIS